MRNSADVAYNDVHIAERAQFVREKEACLFKQARSLSKLGLLCQRNMRQPVR